MTDPNAVRRALRQQVYSHARSDLFSYTQLMFNEAEPSGTFIEANHTKALATAIEKVIRGDNTAPVDRNPSTVRKVASSLGHGANLDAGERSLLQNRRGKLWRRVG